MVDHTGELVNCERAVPHVLDVADVSEVYAEPATWELFEQVADAIVLDSDPNPHVNDPAMDNDDGDDEDARRHRIQSGPGLLVSVLLLSPNCLRLQ
jgi:hypothetical protein